MFDSFITKELIQSVVLELGAVVTSNCHNGTVKLALNLIGKVDHCLLSLTFELEEIDPSVS